MPRITKSQMFSERVGIYQLGRAMISAKMRIHPNSLVGEKDGLIETFRNIMLIDESYNLNLDIEEILQPIIKQLKKKYSSKKSKLQTSDAIKLLQIVEQIENGINTVLLLSPSIRYNLEGILNYYSIIANGSRNLFDDDIWKKMPKTLKNDISEGIECLTLYRWTPAAVVSLRGAEAAVRNYYKHKTGKTIKKGMNWSEIINELNEIPDINKRLVGYLDFVREKRNEALHPGKQYKQREAERIVLDVVSFINLLYKEIE